MRARNKQNRIITNMFRKINEIKRGYQPRNNLVKDENGELLGDSHRF
jgi:hypothetical protein